MRRHIGRRCSRKCHGGLPLHNRIECGGVLRCYQEFGGELIGKLPADIPKLDENTLYTDDTLYPIGYGLSYLTINNKKEGTENGK